MTSWEFDPPDGRLRMALARVVSDQSTFAFTFEDRADREAALTAVLAHRPTPMADDVAVLGGSA